MNSITELLDLEDADIFISDISISGTQKILTIETRPETTNRTEVYFRTSFYG